MNPTRPSEGEQIELWRDRLRTAAEEYQIAAEAHRAAIDAARRKRWKLDADGAKVLLIAKVGECESLGKYAEVLDTFAQLVLESRTPAPPADEDRSPEPLTAREREVLTLIGAGRSTRQISADLGITFKTAAIHRSRILQKFGVHNTAELVRRAIGCGLLHPGGDKSG
ncbi:MAG TPA: LuxR C-terminal-related transcriptional regulator [Bryobacteraceae bacterium]|nr:LuxR C-terminal-related transcriptional regulator [Bryobacteraceae bacterium]